MEIKANVKKLRIDSYKNFLACVMNYTIDEGKPQDYVPITFTKNEESEELSKKAIKWLNKEKNSDIVQTLLVLAYLFTVDKRTWEGAFHRHWRIFTAHIKAAIK